MLPEDKMLLLYNTYVKDNYIDLDKLLHLGFSYREISYLIDFEKIIKVNNKYILNTNIIHRFIQADAFKTNNKDKAIKACLNSLEYLPYEKYYINQLFNIAVSYDDLDNAYKYLNMLYIFANEVDLIDCNYYLFMLSILKNVPEDYPLLKNYAYDMEFEDMIFADELKINTNYLNMLRSVRYYTYLDHYSYAFKLYNDYTRKYGILPRDFISKILLYKLIDYNHKFLKTLEHQILKKEYNLVLESLTEIKKNRHLKYRYECIIKIINLIEAIKNNPQEVVIEMTEYNGTNMYTAIKNNDFNSAFIINNHYLQTNNIIPSNNMFHILLEDLLSEINKNNINVKKLKLKKE